MGIYVYASAWAEITIMMIKSLLLILGTDFAFPHTYTHTPKISTINIFIKRRNFISSPNRRRCNPRRQTHKRRGGRRRSRCRAPPSSAKQGVKIAPHVSDSNTKKPANQQSPVQPSPVQSSPAHQLCGILKHSPPHFISFLFSSLTLRCARAFMCVSAPQSAASPSHVCVL